MTTLMTMRGAADQRVTRPARAGRPATHLRRPQIPVFPRWVGVGSFGSALSGRRQAGASRPTPETSRIGKRRWVRHGGWTRTPGAWCEHVCGGRRARRGDRDRVRARRCDRQGRGRHVTAGHAIGAAWMTTQSGSIRIPTTAEAAWKQRLHHIDQAHARIAAVHGADRVRTAALQMLETLRSSCRAGELALTSSTAGERSRCAKRQQADQGRLHSVGGVRDVRDADVSLPSRARDGADAIDQPRLALLERRRAPQRERDELRPRPVRRRAVSRVRHQGHGPRGRRHQRGLGSAARPDACVRHRQ